MIIDQPFLRYDAYLSSIANELGEIAGYTVYWEAEDRVISIDFSHTYLEQALNDIASFAMAYLDIDHEEKVITFTKW